MAINQAGTVLEQVGSMVYGEISSAWGVKDDLKKLQQIVAVVKPVLEVAEEKQADNPELSIWVTQLKDIFLDAQDVLEEFECQVLRTEVVYKYGSSSKKIGRYFSHSNRLSRFRFSISHKVKDIKRRLDEIWSDKKNFPSINQDDQYQNQTKGTNGKKRRAAATRAYLVAGVVFGREDDKRNILDFLFPSRISDRPDDHPSSSRISDLYGHQKLSVIAIQGVEGIGKTTLAKLVYNDDGVRSHFQHKIWVSVSAREDEEEDFDVARIIRDVIKRVTNEDLDDSLSLDQLESRLRKSLKDQMFLLVLDDVSSLNHEKWSALLGLLETAAPDGRSRIIVTTRKLSIASIVRTVPTTYKLKGLSQENSWHLFLKLASTEGDHDRNRDQLPQHLEEIGREIVEKCEGIPLALKVLSGVQDWTG